MSSCFGHSQATQKIEAGFDPHNYKSCQSCPYVGDCFDNPCKNMTVPVLNMKVYYEEPTPEQIPIKIQGYRTAQTCRFIKRFAKLSAKSLVWTAKKTAWITLLLFAAIEHAIEQR